MFHVLILSYNFLTYVIVWLAAFPTNTWLNKEFLKDSSFFQVNQVTLSSSNIMIKLLQNPPYEKMGKISYLQAKMEFCIP